MVKTTANYFNEFTGGIFIQPNGPNTEPLWLACAAIDGVSQPQGDVSRSYCLDKNGNIRTAHVSQGTPSSVTLTVNVWKASVRNAIQKALRLGCPPSLYVKHQFCAPYENILIYDQMQVFEYAYITGHDKSSVMRRRAEENDNPAMVDMSFDLSANPFAPEIYKLLTNTEEAYRNSTAEDEPLRDIVSCSIPRCATSNCGPEIEPCDVLNVVADAESLAIADGYRSAVNTTAFAVWAALPFIADEHIASVVCVMKDADVDRIIVARGSTDTLNEGEIAYSDDDGVSWTLVEYGTTAGEFVNHSGGLFALDFRHIWLVTDLANVFFSSDGGQSWTDQGAPAPAADEGLWYVHFIDENLGWAVGGYRTTPTGHFIETTDGGEHWNLATTEPKIEMGTWVNVLDAQRVWVGLDDGTVYFTNNWGTTWTQRLLPSTLINTGDGTFYDDHIGAVSGYKTGSGHGVPVVFRTFDGGYSWEEYDYPIEWNAAPTHFGINAIIFCHENELIAVGEMVVAGASLIWHLKPQGF